MEPGAPRSKTWYASITAGVVAILVLLAVVARPAYHEFKRWRALQLTEASVKALQANDMDTARQKAQVALELWPFDARVLRQVATINSRLAPQLALPFWQQTWNLSHDPGDRREVIMAALAANNLALADSEFRALQAEDPSHPLTLVVEVRLRLSQALWPEALDAARRAIANPKAPDEAHLLYVEAAQNSADPAIRAAGLEHLRLLSARTDLLGLRSLRALAFFNQPAPEIEQVAQRLQDHPLANRDDKLLALRLRSRLPGADDDSLVAAARDLFPANDPNSLVDIGRWLISQNKNAEILKLIDSKTALTRRDLFLIRLDAMAGAGQWQAVYDVLQQPKLPIEEEIRLLFEARTLSELHRDAYANLAWERVRLAVANEPNKLRQVALYAVKLRLDDVARAAYQQLVGDSGSRRQAYEEWVALERRGHHTTMLHKVLGDMTRAYPNDPVVRNDFLYTGFLLGEINPERLAQAAELVQQHPEMLAYRVTLALGLLLNNQPKEAEMVFYNLSVVWGTVNTPWRAVFVAVLQANLDTRPDFEATVQDLKKRIPANDLLPEEAALLLRRASPAKASSI